MNLTVHQNAEVPVPLDIVVVDDDQLTLDIVSWIFRNTQSSHLLFNDPNAAMAYLRASMPRILVVDYYMPMLNGIDFLSQLKASVDIEDCSVYLCSAVMPRQEQINQIEALGARVLDKSEICDRTALLGLVDSKKCVTGNK